MSSKRCSARWKSVSVQKVSQNSGMDWGVSVSVHECIRVYVYMTVFDFPYFELITYFNFDVCVLAGVSARMHSHIRTNIQTWKIEVRR